MIDRLMNVFGDCDLKPKLKVEKVEGEDMQVVTILAENGVDKFIFDKDGKYRGHSIEYSVGYAKRKHEDADTRD